MTDKKQITASEMGRRGVIGKIKKYGDQYYSNIGELGVKGHRSKFKTEEEYKEYFRQINRKSYISRMKHKGLTDKQIAQRLTTIEKKKA
jgi:hypothetical protein